MRARITIVLTDDPVLLQSWTDDLPEYKRMVSGTLRSVGIRERAERKDCDSARTNAQIISEMQSDLDQKFSAHETPIMAGYEPAGQCEFVVYGAGATQLIIRVRNTLFGKLNQSTTAICNKARHLPAKALKARWRAAHIGLDPMVAVLETGRDTPSLTGEYIGRRILARVAWRNWADVVILIFCLAASAVLFFNAYPAADLLLPVVDGWLEAVPKDQRKDYVVHAIERCYSALLVTFFIQGIYFFSKYWTAFRNRPIWWQTEPQP